MRAVVIARPGGPEVLRIEERPDPIPGPDEVLVRVRASALNRADLLQRRGRYPPPPGAPPDVPGLEFAGEVAGRGDRARDFERGARVMGIVGGGGQAGLLAVHQRLCLPVPDRLDWAGAAALPEALLTAWDALLLQGGLGAGERVLVTAAGSGVGTAALQVATTAGAAATVGLSRTADKRRRLHELGGWSVLDPAGDDAPHRIREAAAGAVDLVLDLIGPSAWPLYAEVLAGRGRVVTAGLLGGPSATVDATAWLTRRLSWRGTVLRSRPQDEKMALVRDVARRALPLVAAGRLRPVIDGVLPLDQVAEAHRRMEADANLGKLVLLVGEDP